MSHDHLQSMLVEVGMPDLLNRLASGRVLDSVPTGEEGDVITSSSMESSFGEDGAAAAYLAQQGATAVSEDDITSLHSQPALARDSFFDTRRDVTCPCCLGGFWHPVKTPCGHAFCMECLKTWLENSADRTCPVCRTPLGAWRPMSADVNPDLERATRAAFGDILEHRQAEDAAIAQQREAEETVRAMAALAERGRIRELLAAPDAFAIRIGHRPVIQSRFESQQNCYVEPVNKKLPLHLLVSQVRFHFHIRRYDYCVSYTTWGPKFENLRLLSVIDWYRAHIIWKEGLGLDPLFIRIDNLHGERAQRASEIRVLQLSQFCPSPGARISFTQFRECLESSVAGNTTRELAVGNSIGRPAAVNSPGRSASGNASRRLVAGSSPRRPFGRNATDWPAAGINRRRH